MATKLTRERLRAGSSDFLDRFLNTARGDLFSPSTKSLFKKASAVAAKLQEGPSKFLEHYLMALEGVVVSHANRTNIPICFAMDDPSFSGKAHAFLMQGDKKEVAASFDQFSNRVLDL